MKRIGNVNICAGAMKLFCKITNYYRLGASVNNHLICPMGCGKSPLVGSGAGALVGVRFTSMHRLDSGTKLLYQSWLFSVFLVFSLENGTVTSVQQSVADRIALTVVCGHAVNSISEYMALGCGSEKDRSWGTSNPTSAVTNKHRGWGSWQEQPALPKP